MQNAPLFADSRKAEGVIVARHTRGVVQGKTFLTSKAFMAIVGALVPEVYEIDAQEQKFLMELVNKHEGRLTSQF